MKKFAPFRRPLPGCASLRYIVFPLLHAARTAELVAAHCFVSRHEPYNDLEFSKSPWLTMLLEELLELNAALGFVFAASAIAQSERMRASLPTVLNRSIHVGDKVTSGPGSTPGHMSLVW